MGAALASGVGLAGPARAATATATARQPIWQQCHKTFLCATVPVPVDYAQPDGERVGIAVILSAAGANNPSHRALVVNFGGPGDAGTDTLRAFVTELPVEIRDAFDIV